MTIPCRAGALAALFLLLPAAAAQAVTCYVVFDRHENVVYRDVYPPVDLSDQGKADREALRQRGEYLMFSDVDDCPRVEFITGSAGTVGLSLDQILVAPPMTTTGSGVVASPHDGTPKAARTSSRPSRSSSKR